MDGLEDYRTYMSKAILNATSYFNVVLQGKPTFGWHDRSIGSKAIRNQDEFWLRVVSERKKWIQEVWWEGNFAANNIKGIPKPYVIDIYEWEDGKIQLRAELMSFVKGLVCSSTQEIRAYIDLPENWWLALRNSLLKLSCWETDRILTNQEDVTHQFLVFYGDDVNSKVTKWTTAHRDLHWANLMAPELTILDWEGWGLAPAGYDAATLYCYSLLVPKIAKRVYEIFADILNTPEGIQAQLYVITRMLRRIDKGDYIALAGPLHRHARNLLAKYR
ncbi:aminoglycoside phosphotransferase [Laceyella sacchari]|uniref:Aminoglycoside phosphotransferase n=1 Tax=Laceyella sediminis TaxID=573074 RepID=A0ABX5ESF9_9BACL|nr:aminoglycoside phosphotransferase [Laceyella sediminis]AUS07476.1 aminoglycoside phosphotransferase [Laceyella sacchari]PRZ16679.1 hypothetical protein CLV36_102393 [Laceyella sediminis]